MTIVGSFILATGALFGIWLGAYYAAGRLGSQLDEQARWFGERREEEARRFEEQLEAESKRLERQLEHDRLMRDREELRKVLDEISGNMIQTLDAVLDARLPVPVIGNREEGYEETEEEKLARYKARLTAREKIYELSFEIQRLRLRFGFTHPVTTTFNEARQGFDALLEEISVDEEHWTTEQREVVDEKLKRSGRQNAAFIEACRKYTDVEIQSAAIVA